MNRIGQWTVDGGRRIPARRDFTAFNKGLKSFLAGRFFIFVFYTVNLSSGVEVQSVPVLAPPLLPFGGGLDEFFIYQKDFIIHGQGEDLLLPFGFNFIERLIIDLFNSAQAERVV